MIVFFVFIFGLVIGSFLNVCIHRLPEEQSIVFPSSHCPACKKPIAWKYNIPVLGYLILRGKCAECGVRIAPRYVMVELATAAMYVLLWMNYGATWMFAAGVVLFSLLLALTITDFETGYLPDTLTFTGMITGLAFSAVYPQLHGTDLWYRGLLHSVVGLVGGGGILLAVALIGNLIFRKESMGGGDIKLLAMLGAYLGLGQVFWVFFLSPVLSLPFALYMKFARKEETIPFGPFIALAGAAFFIMGHEIMTYLFPTAYH